MLGKFEIFHRGVRGPNELENIHCEFVPLMIIQI